MRKKIILIGNVDYNDYQLFFDRFKAVADTLIGLGFEVTNPIDFIPFGISWMDNMDKFTPFLIHGETALFFDDWELSEAAILLRELCGAYCLNIIDYKDYNEFLKSIKYGHKSNRKATIDQKESS